MYLKVEKVAFDDSKGHEVNFMKSKKGRRERKNPTNYIACFSGID